MEQITRADAELTTRLVEAVRTRGISLEDALAVVAAVAPLIAAKALRQMADRTIAEAVCCDEYEHFKEFGTRPKYAHHICYWGAAHAEALRDRASQIERGEA